MQWHATTAQADIKWTEDIFGMAFKDSGKPLDKLELTDFVPAVVSAWKNVDPDPRTRTFAGLKRTNGRFSDDDLARILHDATEKPAGAYRARGSPACMRLVEMLGMVQARQWGVCTMNEFREFLGLKRFDTFEEWNSDPEIAVRLLRRRRRIAMFVFWAPGREQWRFGRRRQRMAHGARRLCLCCVDGGADGRFIYFALQNAARQLYGHIDNLELYPGLQAEVSSDPNHTGARLD